MLPQKILQFMVSEMPFPAFSSEHFPEKYVELFISPISSVVGNKAQCLRKKDQWRHQKYGIKLKDPEDKRNTNTRTPIQWEKYTSHPSFLAESPLAPSAFSHSTVSKRKIRDCSQSYLDDAFSVIAIWTESYKKDETVGNWLFEYHRV